MRGLLLGEDHLGEGPKSSTVSVTYHKKIRSPHSERITSKGIRTYDHFIDRTQEHQTHLRWGSLSLGYLVR